MVQLELKGRNVLITGGSAGLGAVLVERFAAEGANVAINYSSNEQRATDLAGNVSSKHNVKVVVVQADAGSIEECERCVKKTIEELGGLDVIIGNAGYTRFEEFGNLNAYTEEDWDKCYAVNVKGQMALLRAALSTFNSNADGGAFILTSSVAGATASGSSMPYSVTKAAGLHLMKCLAKSQGPKVRVNAVLPGLLLTEWGKKYSPERQQAIKNASILKKVADLDDAAEAYIMFAKNGSMTGCELRVDSGLLG